ncbi:prohibitin family protein [Azonexus sp.]|uniref:prohibitin family protein n=1 Tax=Azonexus sp. TaxID=1872668 RepID=UPI0027BB08AF|nr:prohibitin family protein [Azonexus sp.]
MDEMIQTQVSPIARFTHFLHKTKRHTQAWLQANRFELSVFFLLFAFLLVFLFHNIYHTVPAGHVGVLWKRFSGGTVTETVYPEGFRLTWPWDLFHVYDVRLQKIEREVKVLSSDGLEITLQLVWRYHLNPKTVAELHKAIGPDYSESLITPTVGARARDIISMYQPEEIYTERRLIIQNKILESVRLFLGDQFKPNIDDRENYIRFEDVLIKGMTLPTGVQDAIVRKNAAFHEMEEYTFRIQKENKEADRKRAEAAGIRHFQEIVSSGMSDSYLRWRGIEATLELAKSPNAKVVVIGNAKNGLPLIMNTESQSLQDNLSGFNATTQKRIEQEKKSSAPTKPETSR